MLKDELNISKIKIYNKWKINPTVKNKLDLLWWTVHILDKIPQKEALKILKEIDNMLRKTKDQNLLYWFLRFLKDNNPFALSLKTKTKIKKLIKEYQNMIEKLYTQEREDFEKYMIKEPLEIIKKYW